MTPMGAIVPDSGQAARAAGPCLMVVVALYKVLEEAVGRRNVHREQETLGPVATAQTCQPRGAECSMHQAGERQCTRREVGST